MATFPNNEKVFITDMLPPMSPSVVTERCIDINLCPENLNVFPL